MNYDKCLAHKGDARLTCQLDKALTNVGSLLASRVEGRVCTEIDPRLANDAGMQVPGSSLAMVKQLTYFINTRTLRHINHAFNAAGTQSL